MHGKRGRKFVLAAALLSGFGCSSPVPQPPASERLEVLTWWTSAGELRAMSQAVGEFGVQHQAITVASSATTGSGRAKEQLRERFVKGSPPDLFQANGGIDLCSWVAVSPAFAQSLDGLAERLFRGDPSTMPQAVLDSVRCTGPDKVQHFYGLPVAIHRNNSLFYNRKVFRDNAITAPPRTVDEAIRIADRLKQSRVVPLALGTNKAKGGTWPLGLLIFEALLPAMAGPDYYVAFFSGRGNPEGPELRAVLDTAAKILDYVNPNFRDLGWDDAARLVQSGQAAMTVMGDWAKGEYVTGQWLPTDDDGFGGRAAFGNAFVISVDTLALATSAPNHGGANDFLEMLASIAGQDAFNVAKGSIPPRMGELNREMYDTYSVQTGLDFATALAATTPTAKLIPSLSMFVPPDYVDAVEAQLEVFQMDRNVDNLILTIRNNYNKLKAPSLQSMRSRFR